MLNYRKHLCGAFMDFLFNNDEKVASRFNNMPISVLEYKSYTLFITKMAKSAKIDLLFMTKMALRKTTTLWGRSYHIREYPRGCKLFGVKTCSSLRSVLQQVSGRRSEFPKNCAQSFFSGLDNKGFENTSMMRFTRGIKSPLEQSVL